MKSRLQDEIRHAYQKIEVSDEMQERLWQRLQQAASEEMETSETFQVAKAPKMPVMKYISLVAACLVMSVGLGCFLWNILEQGARNPKFHPSSQVGVSSTATDTGHAAREAVTEPVSSEEADDADTE